MISASPCPESRNIDIPRAPPVPARPRARPPLSRLDAKGRHPRRFRCAEPSNHCAIGRNRCPGAVSASAAAAPTRAKIETPRPSQSQRRWPHTATAAVPAGGSRVDPGASTARPQFYLLVFHRPWRLRSRDLCGRPTRPTPFSLPHHVVDRLGRRLLMMGAGILRPQVIHVGVCGLHPRRTRSRKRLSPYLSRALMSPGLAV